MTDESEILDAIIEDDLDPEVEEQSNDMYPEPMDVETVQKVVTYELQQAVDFSESELSQIREQAQEYYNGKTKIKHEPGRSAVIITKVRDTVRQLLPSVARIFLQSGDPVEFKAKSAQDLDMISEQQEVCKSIFWNNGGYDTLISAFTDTFNKRVGVVRVNKDREIIKTFRFTDTMYETDIDLLEEQGYEIIEITPIESEPGESEELEESIPLSEVTYARHMERDKWSIECMPPEDVVVNKYAKDVDTSQLFGIYCNKRMSDLIEMGFSWEDIEGYNSDNDRFVGEKTARRGYVESEGSEEEDSNLDPSAKTVAVADLYMRIDADGDGFAELRHIIAIGPNQEKILLDEPANFNPYAIFRADIEPHAFFPLSINETTQEDQDAQTALLRSIIDNAALTNSPRTVINTQYVNIEDHLNTEVGATIRATDVDQIKELVTPFVAGDTLPVLHYLDTVSEKRNGLINAFQGSDPDSLQSVSRVGTDALIKGGQAMIHMIARNLAQGMMDVFILIQKTIINDGADVIEVRNAVDQFIQVDTSKWHHAVDYEINVGIGTKQPEEKIPALMGVAEKQEQIILKLGVSNPMCSWLNLRDTYLNILRLSGIKNGDSFFPEIDAETLIMIDKKEEMKAAQANNQDATAQAIVQAETVKAEKKHQTDITKTMIQSKMKLLEEKIKKGDKAAELAFKFWNAKLTDDRIRDSDLMDFFIEENQVELQHGVELDKVQLEREVNRERTNGQSNI